MSKLKSHTANALLLAVGFLLACGIGELLLRITHLGTPSTMIRYGELPFKRKPSVEFVNRKENENRVVLNNWGFHDDDREPEKKGYRFVAFGDSFVEGQQVAIDQLFTSRAQQALRREMRGAEVVNAGIGGVGTAYEYLLYKEFFQGQIEIDHAILFFMNGNDLPNNHPVLEQAINGNSIEGKVYVDEQGDHYVIEAQPSFRQRALKFLDHHSALSYTVHKALYRLRREHSRKKAEGKARGLALPGSTDKAGLENSWEETIRGTLRLVERWNYELDEQGIEFSIVIIPAADHYLLGNYGNLYKARIAQALIELGKDEGIPVLELDFSQYDLYDIYSFEGKILGHFNFLGHEVAGAQVASWLLDGHTASDLDPRLQGL